MIRDLLSLAFGNGDTPPETRHVAIIEAEYLRREIETALIADFPPLTILERERQAIANKREKLQSDIEDRNALIEFHDNEAGKFRAERGDILRILTGLDKHEAEISEPANLTEPKRKTRKAEMVAE